MISFFTNWLNQVNRLIHDKKIVLFCDFSFSNILRIAESPTHFICELYGSKEYKTSERISLTTTQKAEKVLSTTSFFVPGNNINDNVTASISIQAIDNSFTALRIGTAYDVERVNEIFNLNQLTATITCSKATLPLRITSDADLLALIDIELIRAADLRIYYRIISSAFIVKKDISEDRLINWLKERVEASMRLCTTTNTLIGLNTTVDLPAETFAKQLISLSNQDVTEPIIDSFLYDNANYFTKAMGYIDAYSQKTLKWIERDSDDPYESRPDYLMKRDDNCFDILDLKTGALKFKSLTKSKKSGKGGKVRIRFIDYVSELIAQLHDYNKYFTTEANSKWAYTNHGIKVDKPKLIGIVGNYNNFDKDKVETIISRYRHDIAIMSYYDLANLLRAQAMMAKKGSPITAIT